jgi:hypothetical protein
VRVAGALTFAVEFKPVVRAAHDILAQGAFGQGRETMSTTVSQGANLTGLFTKKHQRFPQ